MIHPFSSQSLLARWGTPIPGRENETGSTPFEFLSVKQMEDYLFGQDIFQGMRTLAPAFFRILKKVFPARPSKCFINPIAGERKWRVGTALDSSWIFLAPLASSCLGTQTFKPGWEFPSVR